MNDEFAIRGLNRGAGNHTPNTTKQFNFKGEAIAFPILLKHLELALITCVSLYSPPKSD
jgi:hypothetical protein